MILSEIDQRTLDLSNKTHNRIKSIDYIRFSRSKVQKISELKIAIQNFWKHEKTIKQLKESCCATKCSSYESSVVNEIRVWIASRTQNVNIIYLVLLLLQKEYTSWKSKVFKGSPSYSNSYTYPNLLELIEAYKKNT